MKPENNPGKPCPWYRWHRWLTTDYRQVVKPKLGPFDPRSESARTELEYFDTCVNCGLERMHPDD